MANIKDVAKYANVGIATVSRVVNHTGSVSKKSRDLVTKAMQELNYIPNATGRSLKKQQTMIIGFIVPNISQAVFSQIAYQVGLELDQMGYVLVICSSDGNACREIECINMVKQNRMDGIIIITDNALPEDVYKGVPTVTVDAHLNSKTPVVSSDNYAAGRKATEFLIEKGCKVPGFIGIQLPFESEVNKRWQAFCDVCKEQHIEFVCELIQYRHGEEAKAAEFFIRKHPEVDGIFATSDYMAYSLYTELKKQGKKIPEEVQIIGFDGAHVHSDLPLFEITTVVQDFSEIGKSLARTMIETLNHKKNERCDRIPASFGEGRTTRK